MATPLNRSCFVLGAGVSGLSAGRTLRAGGLSPLVVDKGRGVGGRIATRRLEQGACDHGAQFFTVKDDDFRVLVEEAKGQGVVAPWSDGFPDGEGRLPEDRHARWRAMPTMTALPKWLARDLDVRLAVRIEAVEAKADHWEAVTETGERFAAAALFLSAPLPQSLGLLRAGKVTLPAPEEKMLEAFPYHRCFSLMVRLAGNSRIPAPGGFYPFLARGNEPISWMADNRQKGTSPEVSTVTILGGRKFSETNFDADPGRVERALLGAAQPWLDGEILETDLHRWRYSEPVAPFPFPYLRSAFPLPLYFIGDAFLGSRVEGAAVSGLAAARDLLDRMAKGL